MTVVPGDDLMTLICDGCGEEVVGRAYVLPDAEVVWTLISELGWSGSAFATGPHHCPRCVGASQERSIDAPDVEQALTRLAVDYLDGTAVIAMEDTEQNSSEGLRVALLEAINQDCHIAVDMSGVRHIDPAELGLLVRAHRRAKERGRSLCLVAPSRFVLAVLHTMRLTTLFPVFDSRSEALATLASPLAVGNPARGS